MKDAVDRESAYSSSSSLSSLVSSSLFSRQHSKAITMKETTPTPPAMLTKMAKNSNVMLAHFSGTMGAFVVFSGGGGGDSANANVLNDVLFVLVVGVVDVAAEGDVGVEAVEGRELEKSTVPLLDAAHATHATCNRRSSDTPSKSLRFIIFLSWRYIRKKEKQKQIRQRKDKQIMLIRKTMCERKKKKDKKKRTVERLCTTNRTLPCQLHFCGVCETWME